MDIGYFNNTILCQTFQTRPYSIYSMDSEDIYNILGEIGRIGNEGCLRRPEAISDAVHSTTQFIDAFSDRASSTDLEKYGSFQTFASEFEESNFSWKDDDRIHCSVNTLYLLQCLLKIFEERLDKNEEAIHESDVGIKTRPQAPPDLISLQQQKTIEGCVKFILYTSYFASLDDEATLYLKMKVVQEKLVVGGNPPQLPARSHHTILTSTLKHLLPLFKLKNIGPQLQKQFLPEVLCGLLQLGFAPQESSQHPQDVARSRQELEALFNEVPAPILLKAILLLKSVTASKKGKCWLRNVCQSLFARRFLLTEGGVRLVLEVSLSIGDFGDWRKKEAVAALISSAKVHDDHHFFGKLCPQIVKLLTEVEETEKGDVFHVVAFVVLQLAKRSPELTKTFLFDPFLLPLSNLMAIESVNEISGDNLSSTVSSLYKLYVQVLPPASDLNAYLEPVLCPLAAVAALPPTCHVKTKAQLIIVRYLNQLDTPDVVSTLLVMAGMEVSDRSRPVTEGFDLVPRLNEIEIEERSSSKDWDKIDQKREKSIIEIIVKLKLSPVVAELTRALTGYLDFTALNDVDVDKNQLMTDADVNEVLIRRIRRLTMAVGLLMTITEEESLVLSLFDDLASAVPIVERLLQTQYQECSNDQLARTREGFLMNCVMLLSCFVTERTHGAKMTSSDWRSLNVLLPLLKELKRDTGNPALASLTELLVNAIATHGVLGASVCKDYEEKERNSCRERVETTSEAGVPQVTTKTKVPKSIPHKTSKTDIPKSAPETTTKPKIPKSTPGHTERSSYQEALVDVCSVHLPVRAHALISFTKLVRSGDAEAIENWDKILSLFEHHLRDEDSYVYLAAIEGLVALSTRSPLKVVTLLTEEFSRGNQTLETRLKLVEILTKTCRNLGPVLPKYKNLFLNCLLNGARDCDPLVRASSFSNLGEVCKELRFSVEPVIHEILSLVEDAIQNDKTLEVRRSAVLLVTLLLQGLGKDSLKVLQSVMLDIYRGLKRIISIEDDPVLVTQAEMAMEEINAFTKDFLMPKINTSKKIFVTDIPPPFL